MKKILAFIFLLALYPSLLLAQTNPRETPVVKVVRDNAAAVVNISTEQVLYLRNQPYWGGYGSEFDFFFDQFFGFNQPTHALKLHSVGSGVILDKEGLIVTNAHVVHMATSIFVILNDGKKISGRVVYEDPSQDLALVKVENGKDLPAVKLGQTQDIMIGESVVAIGNPLGLENSVSVGVVSGKDREIGSPREDFVFEGLLQIDAPINPGNSGGALLNLNGELVGVNVAVVQNSQSIGFAIPVEKVKEAVEAHQNNKSLAVKRHSKIPGSQPPQQYQAQQLPPSAQGQWDPFAEMERMMEEMDQMFENSFSRQDDDGGWGMFNTDLSFDTDFDVEETDKAYTIKFPITGLNKNSVNIEVSEQVLTILGERSMETSESGPDKTFQSKSYSSFMKTIPLPEDADVEKMTTDIQGETLVVTLPRRSS